MNSDSFSQFVGNISMTNDNNQKVDSNMTLDYDWKLITHGFEASAFRNLSNEEEYIILNKDDLGDQNILCSFRLSETVVTITALTWSVTVQCDVENKAIVITFVEN
ncbi:hypothetical protein BAU15_05090 [Enterococcus sp. JM4C]|uniref:hypothetical protein n=1 Tax=Candidatus Enterococcus huntleyi TaxID=1857217 RepID=UPI00137B09BF|nr:hypothetical protein [Enterococcus sp. JM4C]KAF1295129.1 hypothetical protein BAU15_05090 [Enterococcus sp. JM4C]